MTLLNAKTSNSHEFGAGQIIFSAGDSGPVWQIVSGIVRLEAQHHSGLSLVDLALPGDLIGAESVLGKPYAFFAKALISSQIKEIDFETEQHRIHILSSAFHKSQERAVAVMRLREGSVAQRIDHLLEIFQRATGGDMFSSPRRQLPQLKEIASIIGTTPESVCRNLTHRLGKKGRKESRYKEFVSIGAIA